MVENYHSITIFSGNSATTATVAIAMTEINSKDEKETY
jgi:hypothetical protein